MAQQPKSGWHHVVNLSLAQKNADNSQEPLAASYRFRVTLVLGFTPTFDIEPKKILPIA